MNRCRNIAVVIALFASLPVLAQQPAGKGAAVEMKSGLTSVKILFGIKDKEPTTWEGSYRLTAGRIVETDGWRFMGDDYATVEKFRLQVRRNFPMFFRLRKADPNKLPTEPNGIILTLADITPAAKLDVHTGHGDFAVPIGQMQYGKYLGFLKGNVWAERVPTSTTVVAAPTEDDFPTATVGADGVLRVAYVAFTHGKDFRRPARLKPDAKDFAYLALPTGGDQVMYTELSNGKWAPPVPVTPSGLDVFRTAIAVDGGGRTWVFWSANREGNWDLFASVRAGVEWSKPMRLTTDRGPDINHASATDSDGRVWVAWQGFRGDNSDILAMRQEGDGFGKPAVVGRTAANEWSPAIAASRDGAVAVAWDTYAKGDYDVYARVWRAGAWGKERAVSATLRGEARPSVVYDGQNRLWIAYEDAPQGWGKDFGPYDRSPDRSALYRNRRLGVKVLYGDRLYACPGNLNRAMPVPIGKRRWPKSGNAVNVVGPRLGVDANGRVWLGARCGMRRFVSWAGTTWVEFLTVVGPKGWLPAVIVPGTDGLLHKTPAIVSSPKGGVRLVGSSDRRFRLAAKFGPRKRKPRTKGLPPPTTVRQAAYPDAINWEITVADTGAVGGWHMPELTPLPEEGPAQPSPDAVSEVKQVAAIRAHRTRVGGKEVRILRGEFHRHTEISSDGGGDGTIFDMWRYGIDMAAMDWLGSGDHDNGGGREYVWWITQKTTDMFHIGKDFVPMFTYERSCGYPDGHRNVMFVQRGIRRLARVRKGRGKIMDDLPPEAPRPHSPDTLMLYRYLKFFGGICSEHTSGTDMGTDWRDNDPEVEPIVEIYQGDRQNYEMPGAPRTNTPEYSLGGWRPYGFVSLALKKGYRLGFQSSSDHISTHMSYCCVYAEACTREAILEAIKRRHVYGATDNIIAEVRCGEHFMGDEFTTAKPPTLRVRLVGTAPFKRVVIIKDNEYVYSMNPKSREVDFTWTDRAPKPGVTSYYYVRGEQVGETVKRKIRSTSGQRIELDFDNGEVVWASPMWITYRPGS